MTDQCSMPPVMKNESSKSRKFTRKKDNKKRKDTFRHEKALPPVTKKQKKSDHLKGMIIAVSTLQQDDNATNSLTPVADNNTTVGNNSELSYKAVAEECRSAGAQISSQIHKRVNCLLCTENAIAQLTQRVRKAQKKNIPLVDVAWLRKCQKESKRVDFGPFLLKSPTESKKAGVTAANNEDIGNESDNSVSREAPDPDAGWTSPVELGCCCLCHEQNWEKCDWCGDSCNS